MAIGRYPFSIVQLVLLDIVDIFDILDIFDIINILDILVKLDILYIYTKICMWWEKWW